MIRSLYAKSSAARAVHREQARSICYGPVIPVAFALAYTLISRHTNKAVARVCHRHNWPETNVGDFMVSGNGISARHGIFSVCEIERRPRGASRGKPAPTFVSGQYYLCLTRATALFVRRDIEVYAKAFARKSHRNNWPETNVGDSMVFSKPISGFW
ncbi:hypothetical protein [Pseudomonas juntendi]|uniref:hypothetical protein n=1 Tax=Pseudomonas juntendi TaxID=2666183 RepID=UPI0032080CC9